MSYLSGSFYSLQSWQDAGKETVQVDPVSASASLKSSGMEMQEVLNELLVFSRQLSVISSIDVLAPEIARGAVEILRASFSKVLVSFPNHTLVCMAMYDRGHSPDGCESDKTVPLSAQHLYQKAALATAPQFYQNDSIGLTVAEQRGVGLPPHGSLCLAPMRLNTEVVGLLVLGQADGVDNRGNLEDKSRWISFLAEQAAAALYRVSLTGRLRANQLETVLALAKALEARDIYTAGHGQRMTELAERIAVRVGFSPVQLETIRWAALLHDIGKIGMTDEILRRPGPLTPDEWTIMKKHPQIGAEIVMNVSNLTDVAELIHTHHERFDGAGYPRGLAGEEIPLGARIISLVDVYSAMTDGRVYRPKSTHAEAVAELQRCSGANFDPRVVEAFLSLYR
jgi:putative nucleotidyltransferase with HDIG domain